MFSLGEILRRYLQTFILFKSALNYYLMSEFLQFTSEIGKILLSFEPDCNSLVS